MISVLGAFALPTSLSLAQGQYADPQMQEPQGSSGDLSIDPNSSASDNENPLSPPVDDERKFSTASVISEQTAVDENTVSAVDYSKRENIVIYGGWAGNIGSCSSRADNSQVCNSCEGTGAPSTVCAGGTNYACAERSIYDDLLINLDVTLSTLPNNAAVRVQMNNSGTLASVATESGTTTPTAANQSFRVRVKWGSICQAIGGTSCETATTKLSEMRVGLAEGSAADLASGNYQTFTVKFRGVDPTTAVNVTPTSSPTTSDAGVTDFTMLPGDEKAYVRDVTRDSNTPGNSSISYWSSLKVYATAYTTSNPDFCLIDPSSSPSAVLGFSDKTKEASGENSLTSEFLDGLENEVSYMFTGATVDDTTIVQSFLDPSTLDSAGQLRYVATPGEVVGLLDKQKCFVATAAFGSPMNEHVQNLRNFRDRYLLKNYLGKKFVRFYYLNSTRWARWIEANPELKPWARIALWPFVLMAETVLALGFGVTVILLSLTIGGAYLLYRRYQVRIQLWNEWRNL